MEQDSGTYLDCFEIVWQTALLLVLESIKSCCCIAIEAAKSNIANITLRPH